MRGTGRRRPTVPQVRIRDEQDRQRDVDVPSGARVAQGGVADGAALVAGDADRRRALGAGLVRRAVAGAAGARQAGRGLGLGRQFAGRFEVLGKFAGGGLERERRSVDHGFTVARVQENVKRYRPCRRGPKSAAQNENARRALVVRRRPVVFGAQDPPS